MKDIKDNNFYDILLENNQDDIHEYVLSHGKSGKPVAPIMFIKDKDDNEMEGEVDDNE